MGEHETISFSSTGTAAAPRARAAGTSGTSGTSGTAGTAGTAAGGTGYHRLAWLVLAAGLGTLIADPLLRSLESDGAAGAGPQAPAPAEAAARVAAPAGDLAVWRPPGLDALPSIEVLSARAAADASGGDAGLPPLPPRRPAPVQSGRDEAEGASRLSRPAPATPRRPAAPAPQSGELVAAPPQPGERTMAAPRSQGFAPVRTLPRGEVSVQPDLAAPVRPVLPAGAGWAQAGRGQAEWAQAEWAQAERAQADRRQAAWTPPLPPRRPSLAADRPEPTPVAASASDAPATGPRRARRLDLTLDWSQAAAPTEAERWLAALAPAAADADLALPPRLREALLREDARTAEALAQGVLEIVTDLDDPVLRLIREPRRLLGEKRGRAVEETALDLVERSFTAAGDLERVLQRADRRFSETLTALDLGQDGAVPRQLRARQAKRQQAGLALGQEILSRQADYLMAVADLAGALQAMDPELAADPGGLRYADEAQRERVAGLAGEVDRAHAALNRLTPALRGLADDYTAALGLAPQPGSVRVAQTRDGDSSAREAN